MSSRVGEANSNVGQGNAIRAQFVAELLEQRLEGSAPAGVAAAVSHEDEAARLHGVPSWHRALRRSDGSMVRGLHEHVSQGTLELGKTEAITSLQQFSWLRALAPQKEILTHSTQEGTNHGRRDGNHCRPAQDTSQHRSEFGVSHRMRGHGIDGSVQGCIVESAMHDADAIIDGDPAHELVAVAEGAAYSETKRGQHSFEGATAWTQDDAETQLDDTHPTCPGGLGGGFPLTTEAGQKAAPAGTVFVQDLLATVSEDADGRGGDERLRWVRQPRDALAEQAGRLDATVSNPSHGGSTPAATDAGARQMHHRIDSFESSRIELPRLGVPGALR